MQLLASRNHGLRLNRALTKEESEDTQKRIRDAQKAKRVAEEIAKAQLEAIGREKASRRSRAAPIADVSS